jgi:hypothetical protein
MAEEEPVAATVPTLPQPAHHDDREVAVDTLAIYRLIAKAERKNGRASVGQLLAALAQDRKALRVLLEAESVPEVNSARRVREHC